MYLPCLCPTRSHDDDDDDDDDDFDAADGGGSRVFSFLNT